MKKTNNYMKIINKISLGTFFLALLMVGMFSIANRVEAYTFTQTMRLGSTGVEVMELQKKLNTTNCRVALSGAGSIGMETMYFGSLTHGAVRCFQGSHGLGVDGIVGPITRGALNSTVVVIVPPTVPLCPNGMTVPSNCTLAPGQTAPSLCPNGMTVASNCTLSPGGQPPTTGPLQGNEGEIRNAVFISNLNNEQVGESQNNVEVAGLRIEAGTGSDIELSSVRLNFSQGTADQNFARYARDVSIVFDGREVARLNASEFTSSNDFDRTISLDSGTIIRRGQTKELIVRISGVNNLDSANEGKTWTVEFESIRFRDADNAITTDTSTGDIGGATRTFSFEDFATASNIKLEIATTNNNPSARIVMASNNSDTNNVLLLSGELRNDGNSDIEIREMTVRITPSGTGDASEIASSYTLIIDGDEIDTINSNACEISGDCDGTGTNTTVEYVFDNINFILDENDDVNFEVRADINRFTGSLIAEGDSLTAFIDADDIVAEDETSSELSSSQLTGTTTGNEQVFYTVFPEINVTNTSISYVGSSTSTANVSFTVNITARGGTIYLNGDHEGTASKRSFQSSVLGGDANTTLSALVYSPSGNYTVTNNGAEDEYFTITSGNTMTLVLSGSLSQTTTTIPAGAEIDSILFGTVATSDTTRSTNVIDFEALMDQLETNLLTLIGA